MKIILKNTIYVFLAIFLGIYLFKDDSTNKKSIDSISELPQEYMRNVDITHFNEQGNIKDNITASFWAYLPGQKMSQILEPRLSLIKENNHVWHIKAKHGIALHPSLQSKVTKLELEDNVTISRPKSLDIAPIDVITQKLDYFPDKEHVQTREFVKMIKPGLQITGTGLEGYLNKNWVELQSNVKTTYISSN